MNSLKIEIYIRIFVLMLFVVAPKVSKGETKALSDDPNFIQASLLITSQGDLPHQIFGHATLRMECPTHNFDRVFSFNNNTSDDYFKMLTSESLGMIQEGETKDYINETREEGRQLVSYPLNLTLDQKARLWEVLDSLKTTPERPFNAFGDHCFSVAAEALQIAISPDYIDWNEPTFQKNTYGNLLRLSENGTYPWNYVLLNLSFGTKEELKGVWKEYVYPTIFEKEYNQFYIYSPNGTKKPLISGSPKILLNLKEEQKPNRPTPIETSLIVLAITLMVTVFQYLRKGRIAGAVLDWTFWIFITALGVAIALLTFSSRLETTGWNWLLIIFNPIAWIPIFIYRKNYATLKKIWIFYAAVLVIFATFINFLAPSIDISFRIFAISLAVRCIWHVINRINPEQSKMH